MLCSLTGKPASARLPTWLPSLLRRGKFLAGLSVSLWPLESELVAVLAVVVVSDPRQCGIVEPDDFGDVALTQCLPDLITEKRIALNAINEFEVHA